MPDYTASVKKTSYLGRFFLEQVTGIEPVSDAWEASIITTIRYLQNYKNILMHSKIIFKR